jgi:hypothetical protein
MTMQRTSKLFGAAMAALFMGGAILAPISAQASEEGRRNTTLGLGALTGYLFTRGGSKVPAFLGLAGTAYAYKRYNDSINDRHKRERRLRAYRTRRHHSASYYRHHR